MVTYYDPSYDVSEYSFSNDMECNNCLVWQVVEGVGFVQSDGDVWHDWTCDKCGYVNVNSTVANVRSE